MSFGTETLSRFVFRSDQVVGGATPRHPFRVSYLPLGVSGCRASCDQEVYFCCKDEVVIG